MRVVSITGDNLHSFKHICLLIRRLPPILEIASHLVICALLSERALDNDWKWELRYFGLKLMRFKKRYLLIVRGRQRSFIPTYVQPYDIGNTPYVSEIFSFNISASGRAQAELNFTLILSGAVKICHCNAVSSVKQTCCTLKS